jgi:penicillin-binding protein 1C
VRHVATRAALGLTTVAVATLLLATMRSVRALPEMLPGTSEPGGRFSVVDRDGRMLSFTHATAWNVDDVLPLHAIPPLVRDAFVAAEDRRFFGHGGTDWRARLAAIGQNLRSGRAARGASTITEQVVRMLRPRPRTVWSRWIEGIEAGMLERRFSKGQILEFYLNQVPLGGQRRGVLQTARELFDRDLDTLSSREALTLAALARSPAGLDPRRHPERSDRAVAGIARYLAAEGKLDLDPTQVLALPLEFAEPAIDVRAPHFVLVARETARERGVSGPRLRTTLDGSLVRRVEAALEGQLERLAANGATDGAVLVVDHVQDEVKAWVNAGPYELDARGNRIDAILVRRQPGSTLKPFLYAQALERGFTAATTIDDAPLAAAVGTGLHAFRNYSGGFHGPLRLREALGNSLNLPAVRTLRQVGAESFLAKLRALGFDGLDRPAMYYGDGLALGTGEVSLRELVEAYAVLARGGVRRSVDVLADDRAPLHAPRRVFRAETAALVADILSDPEARALEFGRGGVLELPVPTAVKTGTSNDYRDAWAVGFSARHVVGVWIGDLDRRPMGEVTGSIGPGLVLRAVFAELRKDGDEAVFAIGPHLEQRSICRRTGASPGPRCPRGVEWFAPQTAPLPTCPLHDPSTLVARRPAHPTARWVRPTPDLHLAMDPRIPDELEVFPFEVETSGPVRHVEWYVDNVMAGTGELGAVRFPWRLVRGPHAARARIWLDGASEPLDVDPITFLVK